MKRIAVLLCTLATIVSLVWTVSGLNGDGSYWRGVSLIVLIPGIILLIASDIRDRRRS